MTEAKNQLYNGMAAALFLDRSNVLTCLYKVAPRHRRLIRFQIELISRKKTIKRGHLSGNYGNSDFRVSRISCELSSLYVEGPLYRDAKMHQKIGVRVVMCGDVLVAEVFSDHTSFLDVKGLSSLKFKS